MKAIAGLGNPGAEYAETPHNLGFMAADALCERLGAGSWKQEKRFNALIAKTTRNGETLWLLKPQTYMNASGDSIAPFLRYYGGQPRDLLVLSDDCDLPPGRIRVRPSGGPGGHNGLKSLIAALGTDAFARVRIGAGREPGERRALVDFVLHRFTAQELETAQTAAQDAADAALCWLDHGIAEAQNRHNAARTETTR